MDTKSDYLVFSSENLIDSFTNTIPTRRNILSLIAKLNGPIGLIQPIIIKLKLLLQEVCITHADWDLEISGQLKDKFDFIVKFVKTLTTVKISKCYFYDIRPPDYIVSYELHGFSGASKKEAIPRLQLLGNLILSRLILTVLNSFKGEIFLVWIKSYNKEFVTFVQNRVLELRKNVPSEKSNFCSTKVNPADLITRLEKSIDLTKNSF